MTLPPDTSFEDTPLEALTYEAALSQLEQIVAQLEMEELPLETALALFERGQALARRCSDLLDSAELRVHQIDGDTLVDFEP
jgi:exodeoxyribonuclease VII small subunit